MLIPQLLLTTIYVPRLNVCNTGHPPKVYHVWNLWGFSASRILNEQPSLRKHLDSLTGIIFCLNHQPFSWFLLLNSIFGDLFKWHICLLCKRTGLFGINWGKWECRKKKELRKTKIIFDVGVKCLPMHSGIVFKPVYSDYVTCHGCRVCFYICTSVTLSQPIYQDWSWKYSDWSNNSTAIGPFTGALVNLSR